LCQTALTEGLEVKYLSQINIMTKNSGMNWNHLYVASGSLQCEEIDNLLKIRDMIQ
jgi:hypothetical protein